MTNYTNRLKFPVPDFALKPWQSNLLTCFQQIDETIYQSVLNAGAVAWGQNTLFEAGQIGIDVEQGTFWICLVTHTSSSSGNFADDRALHPTYWGLSTTAPEARGAWTTGTSYSNTDFVTFNNGFYICTISHTSGDFAVDLADGKWAVLVDLAPILASIDASLVAIDDFIDTYLGSKGSDPTLDNEGGPLKAGDMYFNTSANALKIYNGSAWVTISPGAPDSLDYVVKTASGSLSQERVLTDSAVIGGVIFDWVTAGIVKAGLKGSGADKILYTTGVNTWNETTLSTFMRTLLDDSDPTAARTTLGLLGLAVLNVVTEAEISLVDTTSNNATTGRHGFLPKLDNTATNFLDGTGAWDSIKDSDLSTSDITTNNATTGKHGFLPKLGGGTTNFLRADGTWATPPDTVGGNPVAGQGISVSGTTVSIDTNHAAGIGSYGVYEPFGVGGGGVSSGATTDGSTLRNVGGSGSPSGTWRLVDVGLALPSTGNWLWIRVA